MVRLLLSAWYTGWFLPKTFGCVALTDTPNVVEQVGLHPKDAPSEAIFVKDQIRGPSQGPPNFALCWGETGVLLAPVQRNLSCHNCPKRDVQMKFV